ncbi:MAG: hypothetical protein KIT83_11505 [Bryobacterales bacterium]|nr:hypothetical protein [Bryobacterales bacterium]
MRALEPWGSATGGLLATVQDCDVVHFSPVQNQALLKAIELAEEGGARQGASTDSSVRIRKSEIEFNQLLSHML